jgi:hypothetical protein
MYDHDPSLAPSACAAPPLFKFWISRKKGYDADCTVLLEHVLRRAGCSPLQTSKDAHVLWCTSHPNVMRNKLEVVPLPRAAQLHTLHLKPQTPNISAGCAHALRFLPAHRTYLLPAGNDR